MRGISRSGAGRWWPVVALPALTGLVSLVLAVSSAVSPAAALDAWDREPADGTRVFVFERLNREYANEVTEAEPIEQGALRVHLTSPSNRVRLIRHELRLTRQTDGTHRAELEVELEGEGQVDAEVSVAGAASRLRDQVTVPRQSHRFEGRVAIERRQAGYVFTALELPEKVTVTFESQLADRFLQTCKLMGALLPLDCRALGVLLSRAVLPLPPPGGSYLLPWAELTDDDRRALDGFLGLSPETTEPSS